MHKSSTQEQTIVAARWLGHSEVVRRLHVVLQPNKRVVVSQRTLWAFRRSSRSLASLRQGQTRLPLCLSISTVNVI